MGMVGYARVSTREQDPTAQEWELRAAGGERMFVDHGESSRVADRPQWLACQDYLRTGDTLVVRALDRLAGTTTLAIQTITELGERGINIKNPYRAGHRHHDTDGAGAVRDCRGLRAVASGQHQAEHHAGFGAGQGRRPRGWPAHRDDNGAHRTGSSNDVRRQELFGDRPGSGSGRHFRLQSVELSRLVHHWVGSGRCRSP